MSSFQAEANRFRLRRDSTIDHEKQLSLALQEIEQVKFDEKINSKKENFLFLVEKCYSSS